MNGNSFHESLLSGRSRPVPLRHRSLRRGPPALLTRVPIGTSHQWRFPVQRYRLGYWPSLRTRPIVPRTQSPTEWNVDRCCEHTDATTRRRPWRFSLSPSHSPRKRPHSCSTPTPRQNPRDGWALTEYPCPLLVMYIRPALGRRCGATGISRVSHSDV